MQNAPRQRRARAKRVGLRRVALLAVAIPRATEQLTWRALRCVTPVLRAGERHERASDASGETNAIARQAKAEIAATRRPRADTFLMCTPSAGRRPCLTLRDPMCPPPLKSSVLMYHDVVHGDSDASGFPGAGPARYKLEWEQFIEHLQALEHATPRGPDTVGALLERRVSPGSWSLTFDDGGSSALGVGDELARRGWRAHFFVPTDFIGAPGFLTPGDIRTLSDMGHVIGSHSCSHPTRISSCSPSELLHEWRRSVELLSDLVGLRITVASVPGGYFTSAVASAAAAVGIAALYTSEPVRTVQSMDGCLVIGRYAAVRGTPTSTVADVALGKPLPWLRRRAAWDVAKVAKTIGGDLYPKARRAWLGRGPR